RCRKIRGRIKHETMRRSSANARQTFVHKIFPIKKGQLQIEESEVSASQRFERLRRGDLSGGLALADAPCFRLRTTLNQPAFRTNGEPGERPLGIARAEQLAGDRP